MRARTHHKKFTSLLLLKQTKKKANNRIDGNWGGSNQGKSEFREFTHIILKNYTFYTSKNLLMT